MYLNNLIYHKDNNLPDDFCNHLINKFEKDQRKHKGEVGQNVVREEIKQSTDLHISSYPEWNEEDRILHEHLNQGLHEYVSSVSEHYQHCLTYSISDTGYQIQKTLPMQYYAWHHDQSDLQCRMLTYMWYLNTVERGGYTEFNSGEKIRAKQGKLLIFPATWEYIHRGFPPYDESKYVCIGWTLYTGTNGIN